MPGTESNHTVDGQFAGKAPAVMTTYELSGYGRPIGLAVGGSGLFDD